jgi:replicative DNA helicase
MSIETFAHRGVTRDERVESAVLAGLLAAPHRWDDFADTLHPVHFATDWLRTVFAEMRRQLTDGKGCDVVSLADRLDGKINLAELHGLAMVASTGISLGRHVARLIEMHRERQLRGVASLIAELASDDGPVQDRIDRAQAEVARLADEADASEWVSAEDAIGAHIALIEQRAEGTVSGIATGLSDLDEILDGGMQRGNLIVVGARPSHGKTALALTLGLAIASSHAVGFLSLEMPHADIRDRQVAILGREPIVRIRRPDRGLDYSRLVVAGEKSVALRFHASDRSGLNIRQVRAMARGLRRRNGLDVLIVDYVGLMHGLDPRQPRAYQIGEISCGLKELAKDLGIVVVALAQVNRGVAERADQTPALHDLRDSGSLEQDADVVALLHRPIIAKPDLGDEFAHYALLRIAKNRQGRTGDVHLYYDAPRTAFESWSAPPPVRRSTTGGHRL